MANEQMGMPAAAPSPEDMAVFDQLRQTVSPKEFSDEMLAGASQVDPQAVAEFRQDLEGLDMPPEVLDALNDLVDEILASPDRYEELRQQYMEQGVPEDLLPEQFDPQFFAALNMAIDQMIAAPAGPQAFAKGGIAELKPIAKAIASYGRGGDTMLAHITPAEARMLKRRGGSGTINPKTGLPEFFIKKIFKSVAKQLKSVGKAIKKFASSTVGRLVTTVALGFFLGPAAASALGVSSAAGVAAVSGFVGSAGSTLAAGGNIRDALKAGAVGGLTAGAGAGLMGGSAAFQAGSYTGPTTVGGQFDKFKSAITPGPLQQAAAPVAPPSDAASLVQSPAAAPDAMAATTAPPLTPSTAIQQPAAMPDATGIEGSLAKPTAPQGGIFDQVKDFYRQNISPSGIQEAAAPAAQEAGAKAVSDLMARVPDATPAMKEAAFQKAVSAATPGAIATYGPMTALGIGTLGMAGGFEQKPPQLTAEAKEMQERLARERQMLIDNPGMFTPKGFERFGAVYNDKGQIMSWNPWTPESAGAFSQYQRPPAAPAGIGSLMNPPVRMADGGEAKSQDWVNQLVREAAQQAGGSLSYADAVNAARNLGIPESQVNAAVSTGLITGAPTAAAPAARPLYESLTPTSTPLQVAAAYQQYADQSGGDIQANQERAVNYLRKLGVSDPTITSGYNVYRGQPATAPAAAPADLMNQFSSLQKQYETLQSRLDTLLAAQKVGTSAPVAAWNTMPEFSNYQTAKAGSPLVPTQSVLGGQVLGLSDPFAAGRVNPLKYLVPQPYNNAGMYGNVTGQQPQKMMAVGGIASLASGGYPRRTGQIEGPGTETSDEIPAMLSDGEFVMTAKAVRGAGGGSRREGAKKMYALMHRLEKNAARG